MFSQNLKILSFSLLAGFLIDSKGMAGGSHGEAPQKRLLEGEKSAPKRVRTPHGGSSSGELTQDVDLDHFFRQGRLYETGRGVPRDYGLAAKCYVQAADRGHGPSQYALGEIYDHLLYPLNHQKAFHYYKLAADQGIKKAQYCVALMYQEGVGVEKNLDLAQHYIQGGAAQGNPIFQYVLGQIFEEKGFYSHALEAYKKAASAGNTDAQFSLAEMYRLAKGCIEMPQLAVDFYKKAAAQGHEGAKSQLLWAYSTGWGCNQDPWMVLKWGLASQDNLGGEDLTELICGILVYDKSAPRETEPSEGSIRTDEGLKTLWIQLEKGVRIHNYYRVSENFLPEQMDVVMAYRKLSLFEDHAIRLLKILKNVEPGFLVNIVKLSDDWQRDFEKREDIDFLTVTSAGEEIFLVLGEKNQRALSDILGVVNGTLKDGFFMEGFNFKAQLSEARREFKKIEEAYKGVMADSSGSLDRLRQVFPHLEIYGEIDQEANPFEKLGQDIQKTKENLHRFAKVYNSYIGRKGLGSRNQEFLNEYPFWDGEM